MESEKTEIEALPTKCGFLGIGMDKVVEEFLRFKKLMESINVNFFLVAGPCLGLVRDGALILHDKDIDVGVMGEECLLVIQEKLINEYNCIRFQNWEINVERGRILWLIKTFGEYVLPIEIQAHYVKDDYVYYNRDLGETWAYREGRLVWDKRLFETFAKVKFAGVDFNVPNPPEEFLTVHYGEDWRVPKAYSDWRHGCKNIYQGHW